MQDSNLLIWDKLTAAEFYRLLETEEQAFDLADRLGMIKRELIATAVRSWKGERHQIGVMDCNSFVPDHDLFVETGSGY